MSTTTLPDPNLFAGTMVGVLALIVAWDAWALSRTRSDIPVIGELANGGYAWQSEGPQEVIRQWGNLFAMAAMIALPWALAEASSTMMWWVILWDILLSLHLISLMIAKRYAITSTHLFADGQRYDWHRLRMPISQPKRRIMLQRKGWSIFAPLPLGGNPDMLRIARSRIRAILDEEE
jgi:hypothetical protein|tara:strand:+ start:1112 stop:1645 length:534 start_codon:yes stop_codon:yes gene_type:complete